MEKRLQLGAVDTVALLGVNDAHLQIIEDRFDASIVVRGDTVTVRGEPEEVEHVERAFRELMYILNKNGSLSAGDVGMVLDLVALDRLDSDRRAGEGGPGEMNNVVLFTKNNVIRARTPGQKEYVRNATENDLTFCIGPAGTGKTYLAVALAIASLKGHEASKIVITRPAVEAGESLGYLPGDMKEKVEPYLRPLYDALEDMLPSDKLKSLLERRSIEVIPLAYMRGRTLNNAFVILDEGQNATSMQMKMFLTRLGVNSKAIVTGDITQIDLPLKTISGLVQIQEILRGVDGVAFAYLDRNDVVRHRLVKDIIDAYEKYHANDAQP